MHGDNATEADHRMTTVMTLKMTLTENVKELRRMTTNQNERHHERHAPAAERGPHGGNAGNVSSGFAAIIAFTTGNAINHSVSIVDQGKEEE